MEDNNKEEAPTPPEAAASTGEEGFNHNPIPNPNTPPTTKGKACRGIAYYTSVHKDKSQNPTCIGFSKTLQQVPPPYALGYTEMELDISKAGRSLTNFKHFCIGYSFYLDNKDSSAGSQDKTAKLPFCDIGFELLFPGIAATSTVGQVPAHARKTEERETASAGGEGCHPRNPISNSNPNPNPIPNPDPNTLPTSKGSKGKACRGVAYYTSVHKEKSQNPTCIGFSKTLQQVPPYVLEYTNMELKASKAGRSLAIFTDFKYRCIGYSAYLDNKDSSAGSQDKTARLPYCFGYEVLYQLLDTVPTSTVGQVPDHARKTEDEHAAPQPQPQRIKPPTITKDPYFDRFQKSAGVVATGVVKNLNSVGGYVKETITKDQFFNRFQKSAGVVAAGVVKNLNSVGGSVKETIDDILSRRPK